MNSQTSRGKDRRECTAQNAAEICLQAGFALEPAQAEKLAIFLKLLMQWNRAMNLVGARSWVEALESLVMDSLWLARFLSQDVWPLIGAEDNAEIWDFGAGAGLPGIPLRLVWSEGTYHMIEAREKRALFISTALSRLNPPRTTIFRGRVEQFLPGRQASIILSRAFMPWNDVLRLAEGHIVPGGRVILLTHKKVSAPHGWDEAGEMSYRVAAGSRYFCAFTPINAPS